MQFYEQKQTRVNLSNKFLIKQKIYPLIVCFYNSLKILISDVIQNSSLFTFIKLAFQPFLMPRKYYIPFYIHCYFLKIKKVVCLFACLLRLFLSLNANALLSTVEVSFVSLFSLCYFMFVATFIKTIFSLPLNYLVYYFFLH